MNKRIIITCLVSLIIIAIVFNTNKSKQTPTYHCAENRFIESDDEDENMFKLKLQNPGSLNAINLYYTDEEDRNYYLYCLDDILMNNIPLKEVLNNQQINIDELTDYLTYIDMYYDGGTKYYKDHSKYSKNGFSLIKCHAMTVPAGMNYNIYIGPSYMEYEEEFCK